MRDAVIIDAVRTPIGKRNGALAGIHPVNLSAHVLRALAKRNSLDAALVDDVIWGCATQVGEQTGGIGRFAVLAAGWPEQIPAVTVERQCGSSQQAVHQAAAGIVAGHHDIAIAGGVESMSRVPMGSGRANGMFGHPFGPAVAQRYPNVQFNQGLGAEMIAARFGLSRRELDEHALDSHRRAAAATDEGRFTAQIAPVPLGSEDGSRMVNTDEGIRRETTLAQLGALKTPFLADGVISAGNASQISDGAAALLLTTPEVAAREGWAPIARVREVAVVGVDPVTMLLGPIPATQKVLARAGLTIEDIGVYEINEAFASVSLAWQRAMDADYKRLNPNGGAIALGHPLGGSGARLMTTLVHHMRDTGARYGLQSMCEFGGMANATILELA